MSDTDFTLGQRVLVDVRNALARHSVREEGEWYKVWRPRQFQWHREPHEREGVVVGLRTYSEGTVHYLGYEDGTQYRPLKYLPVVLVVTDLRKRPLPFRPQDVWPGEDDDGN